MDGLMNTMLQQLAGTVGGAQPQQLAHVARLLQGKKMICTTGAGRTGLVMRMLAMRLAQMGLPVQVAEMCIRDRSITHPQQHSCRERGGLVGHHDAQQKRMLVFQAARNGAGLIARHIDDRFDAPACLWCCLLYTSRCV